MGLARWQQAVCGRAQSAHSNGREDSGASNGAVLFRFATSESCSAKVSFWEVEVRERDNARRELEGAIYRVKEASERVPV